MNLKIHSTSIFTPHQYIPAADKFLSILVPSKFLLLYSILLSIFYHSSCYSWLFIVCLFYSLSKVLVYLYMYVQQADCSRR